MPILLGILVVFAVAAAWRMGIDAGNQAWLPIVLVGILAIIVATALWHRRRMAEIHEKHLVITGRWRRENIERAWPKWCIDCGHPANIWAEARAHDNEETSPCARLLAYRENRELREPGAEQPGFTAEVISEPGEPATEGARQLERG